MEIHLYVLIRPYSTLLSEYRDLLIYFSVIETRHESDCIRARQLHSKHRIIHWPMKLNGIVEDCVENEEGSEMYYVQITEKLIICLS